MTDAEHVDMRVERLEEDDAVVVRPEGDIDLSRSPSFRRQLANIQERSPRRLIVNLSDVPYMDSSGVATLVEAMQVARKHNSRLILCGLQERVRSIFEIARLDTVFTIVDQLESARQA